MREECDTCKFYLRQTDFSGLCRRQSPEIVEEGTNRWPKAYRAEWCGEFQLRRGLP